MVVRSLHLTHFFIMKCLWKTVQLLKPLYIEDSSDFSAKLQNPWTWYFFFAKQQQQQQGTLPLLWPFCLTFWNKQLHAKHYTTFNNQTRLKKLCGGKKVCNLFIMLWPGRYHKKTFFCGKNASLKNIVETKNRSFLRIVQKQVSKCQTNYSFFRPAIFIQPNRVNHKNAYNA